MDGQMSGTELYYNARMERMGRQEREDLQSELLLRQLHAVWSRRLPYRKKMEAARLTPKDIRGIEDVALLPFTDKEDFAAWYPRGMQAAENEKIVRIHATSGTGGKMTLVPCTRKDLDLFTESLCRALTMQGCGKASVVQNAFGYSMFIGGHGVQAAAEKLGATLVPTSAGNSLRQLAFLQDLGTDILCCTPSYAVRLAGRMAEYGLSPRGTLKSLFVAGERLSSATEKYLKEAFGAEVFDVYGNAEMTNAFASCRFHNGMHIPEDMVYAEIVDGQGVPLPDGAHGELIVTALQKTGVPLIRFRTRDLASIDRTPCPCGRTGGRVTVYGRTDDTVYFKGCKINPTQIECVLSTFPHLTGQFQIVLYHDPPDKMEIGIEANGETAQERDRLREVMKSVLGVTFELKFMTEIACKDKAKRVIRL